MGSWLRRTSLVLLACCLPAVAAAQNGFHGVFSRDGTDAWAVGDAGVWYRSLDGGLSWSSGTLGQSRLRDVVARGLTVLVVGDSGKIWRSTNSGGAWSVQVIPGAPDLRGVALTNDTRGYAVGADGTILVTEDGGGSWAPQVSGTVNRLNAVSFTDEFNGWAVGENGTALRTLDGGESWTLMPSGTGRELFGVMQRGSHVWLVGAYGAARRSTNGGGSFAPVDLKLDAHSDVRAVWMQSVDSIYVAGGGGFIRRSVDGGQTWTFPVHLQHGPISDLHIAGATGFAASNRNRIVISSIDRGTTWRMPTGATLTRAWALKKTYFGFVRGSTIALNALDPKVLYCALGDSLFRSPDDGETWIGFGRIPRCTKTNAFIVSPKDTNLFVAAVSGVTAKRVTRSLDHGQTWTDSLVHDYGEYGIPLEYDHDHPDTLYFGGDADGLFRSIDAGATWERISSTTFRSPCDIVVIPDSSHIILVGDGVTGSVTVQGQYWKSTDGGLTFTLKHERPMGASEIPGMSNSRLRPSVTFGTNWGGGGVQRSLDWGETWPSVSAVSSAWGTDIAKDDPNVVIFGVYSGGNSWLSVDGGASFVNNALGGSNYGFYLRDRGTILAEQSAGLYKMTFTYGYTPSSAQSASVIAPNGGEVWNAGTPHDIRWSAANVPLVDLEFQVTSSDPWISIAQVPGYYGSYTWTVPNISTTQAKVRVRDASDGAPEDLSNATFTIVGGAAGVDDAATSFALWQNRPNPFEGATRIGYSLPFETDVTLDVYDLQGQRVATLVRGRQTAGVHSVTFGNGARTATGERLESLPAGVYFYRLQAGSFGRTRKMLLLH